MKCFEGTLILSDLDGTLLEDDFHISAENRAAIDHYIDNGGLFSIATGRSKLGMEHFFPELRINAPAIINNGSVIYDFDNRKDVHDTCIGDAGLTLCKALESAFPDTGLEVYAGHRVFVPQVSERTRRHLHNVQAKWEPRAAESIPQPWLSMVVTGDPERLPPVEQLVQERFPGQFFVQYSSSHMLEIMHPDANKGVAAKRLCRLLRIAPERFYAAGDGPNDIQLLESAYHSCAPADACPQILSIARHILPEYKQHAIAALIYGIEKGTLL